MCDKMSNFATHFCIPFKENNKTISNNGKNKESTERSEH